MTGSPVARFAIPAGHPALPGHFPGRPIVPGVLLLDAVLRAAAAAYRPAMLLRAKFTAPLLPEEEVEIALSPRPGDPTRLGFTCRRGGTLVAAGELACTSQPDPPQP